MNKILTWIDKLGLSDQAIFKDANTSFIYLLFFMNIFSFFISSTNKLFIGIFIIFWICFSTYFITIKGAKNAP